MNLLKSQFDVLVFLEGAKNSDKVTQKMVCEKTGLSAGGVNKAFAALAQSGFIAQGRITAAGIKALKPHLVRRAIFLAAGFGERLIPITLNTPKPLVRIKGVRIIDTMIDAVLAAGIEEIIIVRGYLAEQFDQLLYKYPNIKFVENPLFSQSNNISSMMCVRHLLQNAYVMDADLYLKNPKLVVKYQYQSNYLGIATQITDDWCLKSRSGFISQMCLGGRACHLMIGFSYWSEKDAKRLMQHIKEVYEMPGGKERYWDQVPLEYFVKDYKVLIRECLSEDIAEIDTYSNLKELDGTY